jgi:D-glycero-D-manno-heptose 1,7-bisphosphate phosphatase
MARKCVFFDRDGVVNRAPESLYVERWEDFHLLPGFVDSLRRVKALGYEAVVVTNQKCVALGIVSASVVDDIHGRLRETLAREHGLDLLDIITCPHDDGQCLCRKPQPGMLLEAARRHGLDLAQSWMIGDKERDIEAGHRAGCRTVLVAPGAGRTSADVRVADMTQLAGEIESIVRGERK